MALGALAPPTAAALLDSRSPGLPAGVRERFLREAAGNPLALVELPIAHGRRGGEDAGDAGWLPLTTRLEQAFAARALELPAPTRTALLVAALNDGPLLSEVLAAAAVLADAAADHGTARRPPLPARSRSTCWSRPSPRSWWRSTKRSFGSGTR